MANRATAVLGTGNDISGFLQASDNASRDQLIPDMLSSPSELGQAETPLSPEEEEKLFDELSLIGLDRVDSSLKYDREDIYFDR